MNEDAKITPRALTATSKKFIAGFATTAAVFLFLNLLPYLRTRGAYHGDGYELIGFPFTFRRLGGYVGIYEFRATALLADIMIGLAVAGFTGFIACKRVRQRSGQ